MTVYEKSKCAGFIRRNTHLTSSELAEVLNKKKNTIRQLIHYNQINVQLERKPWKKSEEKFLLDNPKMNRAEIAAILDKPVNSVYTKISQLRKSGKYGQHYRLSPTDRGIL